MYFRDYYYILCIMYLKLFIKCVMVCLNRLFIKLKIDIMDICIV